MRRPKMDLFDSHLFTLDIANNHFGSLKHAKQILEQFIPIIKDSSLNVAIKIQLRDLNSFIHNDYKNDARFPKIERFIKTRLEKGDFEEILNIIKSNGIITMATPFDEESVKFILDNNVDVIKIASSSAQEWPLLYAVASAGKPVIISTGGLSIEEIDSLYYFFLRNNVVFALMHCVSIYPTRNTSLLLNQIDILKRRYSKVPIGFSTHENPSEIDPIKIALAKGAQIFERHIGIDSDIFKLNKYSSNVIETIAWFDSYKKTLEMLGPRSRPPAKLEEIEDLANLKRGVYAKNTINIGEKIDYSNVYFAMPLLPDGVSLKNWTPGLIATKKIHANKSLTIDDYLPVNKEEDLIISSIIQSKSILTSNGINIPKNITIEMSHHYGLMKFREFGAIIFEIINKEYCKKIILIFPRQKHPYHLHKIKQETFIIIHGELLLEVDGNIIKLVEGDIYTINSGVWHKFQSLQGCIFEEISTTSIVGDSYYQDEKISLIESRVRKTNVTNRW